jgi:membrane associated rhomboid family serine protease
VLFYLLCGLAAVAAQAAADPGSAAPMVGASGAIGGVMGGYVLLYPRARIRTFVFVFFIDVPSFVMLGYWFLLQLLGGWAPQGDGGVAFMAHVGGFLGGLLLAPLFRDPDMVAAHRAAAGHAYR